MPVKKKNIINDVPTPAQKTAKEKSLETILRTIEKSMKNTGDPVVEKAPTVEDFKNVPVISFGYEAVDEASYCGGIPQGKMIEIFGPESGGKSLLSLKLIGSAQKSGMKCCLVDAENSYDPVWAATHGVIPNDLYIIRKSMSAEAILDYVDKICASGAFGLIVIDSTAALIPAKELEGSIADQDYALLARAMSKACRKIVANCANSNTTCVFLNQIRDKMNVMFGSNETTPGGKALKFYSHQRIRVTPGKKIKVAEGDKEIVIARESWVQFVKNKAARPFGQCTIEIIFDQTARNPVVKLAKIAKDYKVISLREGTFRISKALFPNEKTNVDTGTKSSVELADYLVKQKLVKKVLDAFVEAYIEENGDDAKIDKSILELGEDSTKIVSPLEGAIIETLVKDSPEITIEESSDDVEEVLA